MSLFSLSQPVWTTVIHSRSTLNRPPRLADSSPKMWLLVFYQEPSSMNALLWLWPHSTGFLSILELILRFHCLFLIVEQVGARTLKNYSNLILKLKTWLLIQNGSCAVSDCLLVVLNQIVFCVYSFLLLCSISFYYFTGLSLFFVQRSGNPVALKTCL